MERQLSRYRELESIQPIEKTADVIRKERKNQNLTLKDLAELSAVSLVNDRIKALMIV